MEFRSFLIESDQSEVQNTLSSLPNKYKNLAKKYKFVFHPGSTLKNDDKHVGEIDFGKKVIKISSGWRTSREFCVLHEVGHIIFQSNILTPSLKQDWSKLVKKNRKRIEDSVEENFCFAFACFYSKYKNETYNHPEWMAFIKKLPH